MYLWSCVKQDIEQFRCRTLYFNCYLDRILLLSNCIGPKARALKPAAHERTCRAYLLFVTSWIDKISSCAGNIYGIFVIRDM